MAARPPRQADSSRPNRNGPVRGVPAALAGPHCRTAAARVRRSNTTRATRLLRGGERARKASERCERHGAAVRRAMRQRDHPRPALSAPAQARDRAPAPTHGAGGLRAGLLDGVHRRLGADRGAAGAARAFRRRSRLGAMGAQRLRAGAGLADADRRRARRRLRQGAHAGHRLPRLRSGVGVLHFRAVGRAADRGAGGAGRGGGGGDADEPGVDRRDLSERGAQPRHRRVGGGLRADHRRRAGAGRLADAIVRLAIRVRHQSAAGA